MVRQSVVIQSVVVVVEAVVVEAVSKVRMKRTKTIGKSWLSFALLSLSSSLGSSLEGLHVGSLALGHLGCSRQRVGEHGLPEGGLLDRLLPVHSCFQRCDLLHPLRVLGVQDEGALAVDSDGGRGDGLANIVNSSTLINTRVALSQTSYGQRHGAKVIDRVYS